ncbi:MAG: D-3-phosphoglycerate dehydrogenase / 2-oxoglutarate reductase, partial [Thermoplasmata archaeon]|nr:D-3-phosphoglycerate dehydrogenase / 2-oxoglutarate reductase [Thermoplasmata archaeon]
MANCAGVARILLTDPLDAEGLDLLRKRGHEIVDATKLEGAARLAEVAKAEAWMIRSGTHIKAEDFAAAKKLRAVGRAGVGVDNVDLAAATARGVAVFHAPTGNITSAAEQAWALMLACARRVPEADASMKQGKWERKLEGVELAGKTLLLVGLGRIGRMMAQRAQAFEMTTLGYDPFVTPEAAKAMGVEWVALDDGLARADLVSLHTPLTAQTRHLIDAGRLARMKPTAILVNAARGPLVDPAALADALDAKRLRLAGIDVWEEEPPADWRLAKHPKVVAAPHLGASTKEAQAKAAIQAAERVADFLATGDAGLAVNAQAAVDAKVRPWVTLVEAL